MSSAATAEWPANFPPEHHLHTVHIRRRESIARPDLHPNPVLARVFAARGVDNPAELDARLAALQAPNTLGGVAAATELLARALAANWRILLVGDYDADGATSTALAVHALRAMGAASVDYLVPNRFEYGYGLTPEIVAVAAERAPQLIITVDNGIASVEGVAAAQAAGIRVLVTDHHLPGRVLPAADAIVNPNAPGCDFPSKALAGVGVIFYVLSALRARLRADGWFAARGVAEPNMADYLDLVALGTVADVVPLDRNNRVLVEQGLRRMRAGKSRPGIAALFEVGKRAISRAVASDLGFTVGPRLNAAGRLDDMSLGIGCLLAERLDSARAMAAELDGLNRERREIEAGMRAEAMAAVSRLIGELDGELPAALCVHRPDWHQGVIGIVAGRVKEAVHRPVIAFAEAGNGELKGSARSIEGLHIRDVLDAVATQNPGLIAKFGGHAMAAGLSLPANRLAEFRAAFAAEVERAFGGAAPDRELLTDGALAADELTLELAAQIRFAGPWGQQFPEPLFDGEFEVLSRRIVGETHLKLSLRPRDGGQAIDAIAFGWAERDPGGDRLRLVYKLDVNEWRGEQTLQLLIEHVEAL
jgi:single-stranded-DNA-specific exonuclease